MRTTFALTCSVLATVVLATAINGPWSDHSAPDSVSAGPESSTLVRPVMQNSPQPPPACTPQNLRASLRPQDPLPAPGQMPAGSTMARIFQRGHLTAGVLEDVSPMAFRDVRDENSQMNLQMKGFDVDIARDIAEAIFGDRQRVVFRPLREADRAPSVESGQVDLAVATATITCSLREQLDFSTVYYEAGQRTLVNRGSAITGPADMGGKQVCAARGSTSLQHILALPAKPIPVITDTESDCLMLLQLGKVDAVSTDDTLLAAMATQDLQTKIVGPRFTEEPYGIEINKNAPDLVRFVNALLARRVEDGRWRASYERWLTPLGPPPAPPTPQYQD